LIATGNGEHYNGTARTGIWAITTQTTRHRLQWHWIGSTPSAYGDKYPLIQPVASYEHSSASPLLLRPLQAAKQSESECTTTSGNQSSTGTGLPDLKLLTPWQDSQLLRLCCSARGTAQSSPECLRECVSSPAFAWALPQSGSEDNQEKRRTQDILLVLVVSK